MKLHNRGVLNGREIILPEQVIIADKDAPASANLAGFVGLGIVGGILLYLLRR